MESNGIAEKRPKVGSKKVQHCHHDFAEHVNIEANAWQSAYDAHKKGATEKVFKL